MIFAARERRAAITLAVIATVAKRSRVPRDSPSMRSQNRSCSPGFSNSRLLGARRGQTGRVGGGGTLDCYTRNDGSRVMGLVDPEGRCLSASPNNSWMIDVIGLFDVGDVRD